jgi:integrase
MSKKGINTTSDYIDFDRALNKAKALLSDKKTEKIGLYILVSIHTGLRTGDVLSLTWEQLRNDVLIIKEQKTGKDRKMRLHNNIVLAVSKFPNHSGHIFISQKGGIYTRQQINRKLKDVFSIESNKHNISTHSLRKTFGRRVYEHSGETESALMYLSEMFNHTSLSITRKYLGIRQEELDEIYLSI